VWPLGAPWMDAVELPLLAKVEFGKILASAVPVTEGADGASARGGSGEVLRRCADADRRHGGGMLYPRPFLCLDAFIWKNRM
jgi:hypothetical protein